MALTSGRTPLLGSPPLDTASTLSDTSGTNQLVANTTKPKPFDGKPPVRLGLIAKPGEEIAATGTDGSSPNRPLRNALEDFDPVGDVVKAVSDSVQKALGKDDSAAGDADSDG